MSTDKTLATTAPVKTFSLAPTSLQQAMELAKIMAESDMVPKDFRGKPGNVLIAVQMGAELGLQPMQAIQNIAVINGRPTVWGDALLAIVSSHPECEDIQETLTGAGDAMEATCVVKRKGREPVSRTFTVLDAKRANLWGKEGPWRTYPQRMLPMRARSWAMRDSFADALRGINIAEEVMDIPVSREMGDVNIVAQEPVEQPRAKIPANKPPIDQPAPTEVSPSVSPLIGDSPMKLIRGMLTKNAITEAELCAKFSIVQLEDLRMSRVNEVIAWISSPS